MGTKSWDSNNDEDDDEDDDEYEDCCETDDARKTSTMHVCISRQQLWNCTYHVHKYSCASNRIHGSFLFLHELSGGFGGRLIFGVDLYSGKCS